MGNIKDPITAEEFAQRIEQVLQRKPLICIENGPHLIRKIGICTGGGQGYIDLAAAQGCDAFITGEGFEQTIPLLVSKAFISLRRVIMRLNATVSKH